MAAAAAPTTFATTPPSTYVLTTTGEAALLTSYGIGGIATQQAASSYSYSAYSHSTPGSGHTVVVAGDGSASDSSASNGFVSGWNALSNTTKYAIYGGAGAVVLIIIIIIILVVRRSRRKSRQSVELRTKGMRDNVRMTQRSSFASPMHAMNDSTLRSNEIPAGTYAPPSAFMHRNDSNYSLDKGAYQSDAYSVHSAAPAYGNQTQNQQFRQEEEAYYPPQRSGSRSPPSSNPASPSYQDNPYHHQQQQYSQQQERLNSSQHGYAYTPEHEGQRAVSPSYSQRSFGRPQNPYAAFAHDGQQEYHQQQGYGQPQQRYNGY